MICICIHSSLVLSLDRQHLTTYSAWYSITCIGTVTPHVLAHSGTIDLHTVQYSTSLIGDVTVQLQTQYIANVSYPDNYINTAPSVNIFAHIEHNQSTQ